MCLLMEVEIFCAETLNGCYLGHSGMSYDHHRISGPPLGHKTSGTIDVIGSSVRDSRRQPLEFRESEKKPDLYAALTMCFLLYCKTSS